MKYYIFSVELQKYVLVNSVVFFDTIRKLNCSYLVYSFNTVFFCIPDDDLPTGISHKIMAFCIDVKKPFKVKENEL